MNSIMFTRLSRLAAAIMLLGSLTLAPAAADARAGGGFSMGSRGSRTYSAPAPTRTSPYSASPMNQSMTPRGAPFGSGGGMMGAGRGHPLVAGLLGGFLGAGIGGMLFGHGFMGGGGMGLGGLLGLLIQIALVVFVVRWLMRRFAGANARSAVGAAPGGMMGGPGNANGYGQPNARMASNSFGANTPPVAITQADYRQFEQTLRDVQAAWTRSDLSTMQRLATPEMVNYFAAQLQDQSRRGIRNAVSDVRLDTGDLSEAWNEGNADYATVAMRYSMIDVTTDGAGRVVDGSPQERVSVAELWTFMRARGGGWVLSAIQQTR